VLFRSRLFIQRSTFTMAKKKRPNKQQQLTSNAVTWQMYACAMVAAVGILFAIREPSTAKRTRSPADYDELMSQCTLVMANSSILNSGWGMFSLVDLPYGSQVTHGDPIIQIPDLESTFAKDVSHFLHRYAWNAEMTGGLSEGKVVYSALPGTGSLANGHPTLWNSAPGRPQVDAGGLVRSQSPGAGSITHYHNFSFFVHRALKAGQEILVNYGSGWDNKISSEGDSVTSSEHQLRRDGLCLDHIRPGTSTIPHAGRGALATRSIKKGQFIAPVPLMPIMGRQVLKDRHGNNQLFVNYLFGHKNSSILFFPYSPIVNLINHGDVPNAVLRWSNSTLHYGKHFLDLGLDAFRTTDPSGLLLEIVALREIAQGDEILLDYGKDWKNAWKSHVEKWNPPESASSYIYPHTMDVAGSILRTKKELATNPYPPNIETYCYYRYSDNHGKTNPHWINKPGVLEIRNLRPCVVIARNDDTMEYYVQMFNRKSLVQSKDAETIPDSEVHLVSNVPRTAIRLADRTYSSDQHMRGAFRHEIAFPDSIFPMKWQDLS